MDKVTLSPRQLQVMEILWKADGGMTASAIVRESEDLQINTVQAALRSLCQKNYAKVGDIVYSGTVLSRSFIPVMSKEDYLSLSCQKLAEISPSGEIMMNLINDETDLEVLTQAENLIKQRKKELHVEEKEEE